MIIGPISLGKRQNKGNKGSSTCLEFGFGHDPPPFNFFLVMASLNYVVNTIVDHFFFTWNLQTYYSEHFKQ